MDDSSFPVLDIDDPLTFDPIDDNAYLQPPPATPLLTHEPPTEFAAMDFEDGFDLIESKDRSSRVNRRTPYDSDDEVQNVLTPSEEQDL